MITVSVGKHAEFKGGSRDHRGQGWHFMMGHGRPLKYN